LMRPFGVIRVIRGGVFVVQKMLVSGQESSDIKTKRIWGGCFSSLSREEDR